MCSLSLYFILFYIFWARWFLKKSMLDLRNPNSTHNTFLLCSWIHSELIPQKLTTLQPVRCWCPSPFCLCFFPCSLPTGQMPSSLSSVWRTKPVSKSWLSILGSSPTTVQFQTWRSHWWALRVSGREDMTYRKFVPRSHGWPQQAVTLSPWEQPWAHSVEKGKPDILKKPLAWPIFPFSLQ